MKGRRYRLTAFKLPMIQYSIEASSRSGSAVSFNIMSRVWAREWTAMPARTMVPCPVPGASLVSARVSATAVSPPRKEAAVTGNAPADKKRMPKAAPALAPEETPIISGEARGLWKTI